MKFSVTLRLLFVVCLLAALILLLDRKAQAVKPTSLLSMNAADITEIRIEKGDFHVYCFRKGESWFIGEPIRVRADDNKIDRIAGVVETMARQEVITRAERETRSLSLKDYGLQQPRVRLVITGKRGGEECREEILVGHDAPLGGLLYVRTGTNEDVVATSREIMDCIPEKIEALRDRSVLHGDVARTSRLEIKRAGSGFIQLAHTEDGWFVQQPIVARAGSAKVMQMLHALYLMRVKDFTWDATVETGDVVRAAEPEPSSSSKAETYRLTSDEAVIAVTVWREGEDIGRELFFGKAAGEKGEKVYVRCKDVDSIYTVSGEIMDIVNVGINDLRDKNLFTLAAGKVNCFSLQKGDRKLLLKRQENEGWTIVEPVQWKADDRFVDEIIGNFTRLRIMSFTSVTNTADLGASTMTCIVGLSEKLPEVSPAGTTNTVEESSRKDDKILGAVVSRQGRLLIGAPREGKETVFAKFEGEPYALEISRTAVDFLGKDPVDPLVYRDRTMLMVKPETVRRISLLKNGQQQAVERDDAGNWNAAPPATNRVDAGIVESLLFAAANMRATRIECQNPDNLVQYGLDRSGTTLTFGLTGEKGIQKSLVMGFRAGTDGIYALVQGLDVVFVISNEMMNLLTRDLSKPVPAQ